MDRDIAEVVLYLVIFIVIGLGSLVKALYRSRQKQAETRDEPKRAQGWRPPTDDVRNFLEEVAQRAGKELGYPEALPKPAPPRPAVARPTARPAGRPSAPQPAQMMRKKPPRREPAVVIAPEPKPQPLEEVRDPRRISIEKPKPKKAAARRAPVWLDKLPKKPLAKGIVLREILGPPRALNQGEGFF